ncbi:dienelactone hydrolase [Lentinula raphanica]|uniref:Dienelactone hydrolase n=1 Tax=Lentinula raphanica TaxID=153919 RepID=A0AA38P0W0_9AGAR|nr:dienelactone hydrolase [Lentinula raphanica]KAJ3834219.1 dienelactone hydrolase [Lentinula raphanica]
MSSPLCEDCVKGVKHEGEAKGHWESIGGVNCYVGTPASPSQDSKQNKAILYFPDVFGMQLINNQLLVDSFAENGFLTIGVDYFDGDPIPENALEPGAPTFDRNTWFSKHEYSQTRPYVDKVYDALKERGITAFASVGYCFGASYTFPLAIENKIQVAMIAHPSRSIPDSLQGYFDSSKAPLLINSCEFDPAFPLEACQKADAIFSHGNFSPGYKRVHWPGCKHGFAVRGDMSVPEVKAGKEGAFRETVEWFSKYL